MTPRRKENPPTFHDRLGVSADELAELFGPDWRDLTYDEALGVLHDTLCRLVAEHDQATALINDINYFTMTLIHAVADHGTTRLDELCDNVATNLGGHTTGTTFALTSIAGLAEADERHHDRQAPERAR